MSKNRFVFAAICCVTFYSATAFGADFEGNLRNVVNAVLTKIFPLIGLYFAGEAFVLIIQGRPEAKDRLKMVGFGLVGLLGINAAWSWIAGLVR